MDATGSLEEVSISGSSDKDDALFEALYDIANTKEIVKLIKDRPGRLFQKDVEDDTVMTYLAFVQPDGKWSVRIPKLFFGVEESEDGSSKITNVEFLEFVGIDAIYEASYHGNCLLLSALLSWSGDHFLANQEAHHTALFGGIFGAVNEDAQAENDACDIVSLIIGLPSFRQATINNSFDTTRSRWSYSCPPTPLQMAAEAGLTNVVKILLSHPGIEVLKRDANNQNALHLAAQQGSMQKYDGAFHCIIDIIAFIKKSTPVNESWDEKFVTLILHDNDNDGLTPFHHMCETYPSEYISKFLTTLPPVEKWASGDPLIAMHRWCPQVLIQIMESSFDYREEKSGKPKTYMDVDFGIITGYKVEFPGPYQGTTEKHESTYIEQTVWHTGDIREQLLLHPLVHLYVENKWKMFKGPTYLRLILQLLFVVSYTNFFFRFYPSDRDKLTWTTDSNLIYFLEVTSLIVMYIGVSSLGVVEVVDMMRLKGNYLKDGRNLAQLIQILSATCILYPIWPGGYMAWNKYAGLVGLFLSYLLVMRDVGKAFTDVGILVEVLARVIRKTVTVLVCCLPIWAAFGVVFLVIFHEDYMYFGGNIFSPLVRLYHTTIPCLPLLRMLRIRTDFNLVKDVVSGQIEKSKLLMKFTKSRSGSFSVTKEEMNGETCWNCQMDQDLLNRILALADASKQDNFQTKKKNRQAFLSTTRRSTASTASSQNNNVFV